MKAILRHVSEAELARRHRLGLDRWDEMWEGVLHMTPAPADEHQRILGELFAFLRDLLVSGTRGTLRIGINIFDESSREENYRIPDLTFVATGREGILSPDGIRGGGPDAVVEIRSPGDETLDKLPFFEGLQVREVIVIDAGTKKPEVFRLAGNRYLAVAPDPDGGVVSETLGVRLRLLPDKPPRLAVEDREDPSAHIEI